MLDDHYSTKHSLPVRVGRKVIGWVENRTFYKPVVASKHKLKSPPAWAVDADAFDQQIRSQATGIVIQDKESGTQFEASMETFDHFKGVLDRGFGRQYFLTMTHWQTRGNGQRQLTLWEGMGGD